MVDIAEQQVCQILSLVVTEDLLFASRNMPETDMCTGNFGNCIEPVVYISHPSVDTDMPDNIGDRFVVGV